MRICRILWTLPVICLAFVFFPAMGSAYGQVSVLQDDSAAALLPAPVPLGGISEMLESQQPKALLLFRTDTAEMLHRIAETGSHPPAFPARDGRFSLGPDQGANSGGSQSNPGRTVRKAPLILGIVGAVVMVAGIAVATDNCGIGPCFRTAGVAAAVAGGAAAVTGFYFAFRR